MNKTKIEWTDYTWNPITGCLRNCWYCYARRMFKRFNKSFEPAFHPERLKEIDDLKTEGNKIFVCSVADLFAEWTDENWTRQVLDKIRNNNQEFQLLTKVPERLKYFDIPYGCWVGVTCNNRDDYLKAIKYLSGFPSKVRFLSFEPLLGDVGELDLTSIHWIIIGKLTGSKKIELKKEWVENILIQARKQNIPVFIKNNVGWKDNIQEFPDLKNATEGADSSQ